MNASVNTIAVDDDEVVDDDDGDDGDERMLSSNSSIAAHITVASLRYLPLSTMSVTNQQQNNTMFF